MSVATAEKIIDKCIEPFIDLKTKKLKDIMVFRLLPPNFREHEIKGQKPRAPKMYHLRIEQQVTHEEIGQCTIKLNGRDSIWNPDPSIKPRKNNIPFEHGYYSVIPGTFDSLNEFEFLMCSPERKDSPYAVGDIPATYELLEYGKEEKATAGKAKNLHEALTKIFTETRMNALLEKAKLYNIPTHTIDPKNSEHKAVLQGLLAEKAYGDPGAFYDKWVSIDLPMIQKIAEGSSLKVFIHVPLSGNITYTDEEGKALKGHNKICSLAKGQSPEDAVFEALKEDPEGYKYFEQQLEIKRNLKDVD